MSFLGFRTVNVGQPNLYGESLLHGEMVKVGVSIFLLGYALFDPREVSPFPPTPPTV